MYGVYPGVERGLEVDADKQLLELVDGGDGDRNRFDRDAHRPVVVGRVHVGVGGHDLFKPVQA